MREKNIVLIFDECTSGFRETFGGIYKKYGVEPDVAIYGKTLGNGYGITAVVGKKEIMDAAQKTFISSTFWTERIGPSAALATLKVMEKNQDKMIFIPNDSNVAIIRPRVENIRWRDFHRVQRCIKLGAEAVDHSVLNDIKNLSFNYKTLDLCSQ